MSRKISKSAVNALKVGEIITDTNPSGQIFAHQCCDGSGTITGLDKLAR